jgi:hypothetical protein
MMNMSISDAVNYPFRNNNMLKILPIAIAYSIVLFFVNVGSVEGNMLFICGGGIALIAFSMFLGGYYLSALRRLQNNDENLPEFEIRQNISDGFITGIAGLVYMIPVILLAIIAIFLGGGVSALNVSDGGGGGGGVLLMCGLLLGAFILALILSAALTVGIVRFAAEGNSSVLWDFGGNWSLATGNFGTVLGLWGRTFVIGLLGAIVSGIFGAILGVMYPDQRSPLFEPTTAFWLVSAVFNIITYTISVFMALAQYHLMSRFGFELGIGTGKAKNEAYEF